MTAPNDRRDGPDPRPERAPASPAATTATTATTASALAEAGARPLLSVAEARARILAAIRPTPAETVSLDRADGRVLAADVVARRDQPAFDASAMDGYAVRADDARVGARLRLVGESAAGARLDRPIGPGECARIFTGAPLPEGADAILIQENATRDGDFVAVDVAPTAGRHIRPRGLDFSAGAVGLEAGRTLSPVAVALAAAMGAPWLRTRRRPRVAILATGDELVLPGDPAGPDSVIASNSFGLAAFVRQCGGEAVDLGVARDSLSALEERLDAARGADLLVTLGGASVGDRDLVGAALAARGFEPGFWRIAMRPGKPLMFGALGGATVIGLPGNPVSSMVCALIFIGPAIAALLGRPAAAPATQAARLGEALPANDQREDYLRARLEPNADGEWTATAFARQDSAMLATLARADGLILRPPHAPAARAGDIVRVIPLTRFTN